MKKIKLIILLGMLVCLCGCGAQEDTTAYDYNNAGSSTSSKKEKIGKAEEDEYCFIRVIYSNNITPQENDTFEITYELYEGSKPETVKIDASQYVSEDYVLNLPANAYRVKNIEYKGKNKSIQNYGIVSVFNSTKTEDHRSKVKLTIGITETQKLVKEYQDTYSIGTITDKQLMDDPSHPTLEEAVAKKAREENSN